MKKIMSHTKARRIIEDSLLFPDKVIHILGNESDEYRFFYYDKGEKITSDPFHTPDELSEILKRMKK
jgi:hypothetical protein